LAVVASNGQKAPLVLLDEKTRLNSDLYIEILKSKIFPWARKHFGQNWIWQQDGASCHTSLITQKFLQKNCPDFFPKDLWPPHSPDLSPLDFGVFGHLKAKLSGRAYKNKEEIRRAVSAEWRKLDPEFIWKTCTAFRSCIEKVIDANGGYIE
jgi:hypothetical protein